jgi:hypothetical protein
MTMPKFTVRLYLNAAVVAETAAPARSPAMLDAMQAAARRAAAADREGVPWLVTVDDGQTVVATGTDMRPVPAGSAILASAEAVIEVVTLAAERDRLN